MAPAVCTALTRGGTRLLREGPGAAGVARTSAQTARPRRQDWIHVGPPLRACVCVYVCVLYPVCSYREVSKYCGLLSRLN